MKYTKTTREVLIEVETIRFTNQRRTKKKPVNQPSPDTPGKDYGKTDTFVKTDDRRPLFDLFLRRI